MRPTKAILCLWVSCSASATFAAFHTAYYLAVGTVLDVVTADLGHEPDLNGPENFTINFPAFSPGLGFIICVLLAVISLLVSWRMNKQPLFSWPHVLAVSFFVPAGLVMLIH